MQRVSRGAQIALHRGYLGDGIAEDALGRIRCRRDTALGSRHAVESLGCIGSQSAYVRNKPVKIGLECRIVIIAHGLDLCLRIGNHLVDALLNRRIDELCELGARKLLAQGIETRLCIGEGRIHLALGILDPVGHR